MQTTPQELTQLLVAWSSGDKSAFDRLMPLVYEELRKMAYHHLAYERPGHTLQTRALVNEAYLRLIDQRHVQWQNRAHFFAIAARVMRRVLVDYARARNVGKRGGGTPKLMLEEAEVAGQERANSIVALDEALERLKVLDPRKSRDVELRFFGGLSNEEIAEVLEISANTVMRDWNTAKAWLHRELNNEISNEVTNEG
jgi:RNA polymerase sigma factor (TIGR02999 family)